MKVKCNVLLADENTYSWGKVYVPVEFELTDEIYDEINYNSCGKVLRKIFGTYEFDIEFLENLTDFGKINLSEGIYIYDDTGCD